MHTTYVLIADGLKWSISNHIIDKAYCSCLFGNLICSLNERYDGTIRPEIERI